MSPMLLAQKSVVVISPVTAPIKRNDVILFPSGEAHKYILHRVIKVREGYCVTRGDNSVKREMVKAEGVSGVLTAFNRKGKWTLVTSGGYLFYARALRVVLYPWVLFKHIARRLFRRYKGNAV